MTFVNESDYDELKQDDELVLSDIFAGLENGTFTLYDKTNGKKYEVSGYFTARQQNILKAGSMLAFTKGV